MGEHEPTELEVEAAAEAAYVCNRGGSVSWGNISEQYKSDWRAKVTPVLVAASRARPAPSPDAAMRALLQNAAIFLEVGSVYCPDERVGIKFPNNEEFNSRGLATVMKEVAKDIRTALHEGEAPGPAPLAAHVHTSASENESSSRRGGPSPEQMREALEQFFTWAIESGPFDGCDLDGGGIQDKAAELGLLIKTKYDPDVHGQSDVAEPGDDWFVFNPAIRSLSPASEGERDQERAESVPSSVRSSL